MQEMHSNLGGPVTRRRVVGGMIATPAAMSFPASASAAGATPTAKIIAIVARKAGLSPDRFRAHWLGEHAPLAGELPGIDGLVLSEAVLSGTGDGPFDGIAHAWYPRRDALRAGLATPEARAWIADGNVFIDRDASRTFLVSEQIVIAPPRSQGGIKQNMLLVRRPGMTHAQFLAEWTGAHAELARDMPGLVGCVFNRVDAALGAGSAWSEIGGIAELWWEDGAINLGGAVASPQASAWAADGDRFIDRERSRTIVSLEHVVRGTETRWA